MTKPKPPRAETSEAPTTPTSYPPVPVELTERQADLWRQIVRSKPPSWWDAGSLPLLRALVCHVATFELVQTHFAAIGPPGDPNALDQLERLTRLRERESKNMATLAAKLRLTQQSRYTPQSAATAERSGHDMPDWMQDPLLARYGL